MMDAIPAITIWQPWAMLIAEGAKRFEFRNWPAPKTYQGKRIAIHAGARPVRRSEVQELLIKLRSPAWRETGLIRRDLAMSLLDPVLTAPGSLPLSSVVCTALLGSPINDAELEAELGLPVVNDSDRDEHTNWAWPLSDVQRLVPYQAARGAQGFWMWTPAG